MIVLQKMFIKREKVSGGATEREGERERERIPSGLLADSTEPDAELELMNCEIMT